MGLVLCLLGFAGVATLTRRSVGHGLGLLLAIGSIYGLARAQVFDGFTHFLFDASVLGAYVGGYTRTYEKPPSGLGTLRSWLLTLSALPFLLILVSPLLDAQPVLVQLLGLRPALLFLPLMLLGAMANRQDWVAFATWGAFVAIGSALVMAGEYYWGVEQFFPVNDASKIIYLSRDIGAGQYRLPATFSSAHAYGGTMAALVPLTILLVESEGWRRRLGVVALAAGVLGVFACGARSPVITLAVIAIGMSVRILKKPALRAAVLTAAVLVGFVVPQESRFQRFETLSDSVYVESRVAGSVNSGLLDIVTDYPFGRGLGSAVGTSIPYFLADEAKPQYGMENEYSRIAVEQGILGVVLWLLFAGWVLYRNPFRLQTLGGVADLGIWAFCAFSWGQGFIGTGFLASVPGTMLLMLYIGYMTSTRPAPDASKPAPVVTGRFAPQQGV
jgi:hypothetical protein